MRLRVRQLPPLYRTAGSLMASTLLSSLLGLGFWTVAARVYPVHTVGRDSALIAAMSTISMLCQVNLNNVMIRFLPQLRERIGRRVVSAYALTCGLSLVVGSAFVLVAPTVDSSFSFLTGEEALPLALVLAVAGWSVFTLQDAVLTGLGFPTWLPIENGLFSAAKIVVLPLMLIVAPGHGVFLAWVLPLVAIVPVINWLIARRVLPHARTAQRHAQGVIGVFGRRRLIAFLAQDFLGTAAGQIAITAVPLIVLARLGPTANGYFYIPFTLIVAFDLLSVAVASSLTTEAARAPEHVDRMTRTVMRRFLAIEVPVVAIVVLAAPWVLLPFGPAYARHGATLLRLMAGASCFRSAIFLYCALARLQGRGLRIAVPQACAATLLIGLTTLLSPSLGLDGVGVAWLSAFGGTALALLPGLIRLSLGRGTLLPDREILAEEA